MLRPPLASYRYAIAFLAVAAFFFWRSSLGEWRWVLLWPAAAFTVVGVGYLGVGAMVVGKQTAGSRQGQLRVLNLALLLPYLALVRAVWHGLRLGRTTNSYDELWPDIVVGRRLMGPERLPDIERVLDLTCEMEEPAEIRREVDYWAVPTLDQTAPHDHVLIDLMGRMREPGPRTYVHCAEGFGRAGTVAVCLALVRGEADDVEGALAWAQKRRPRIRLSASQRRRVDALAPRLLEVRREPNP